MPEKLAYLIKSRIMSRVESSSAFCVLRSAFELEGK